MIAPLLNLVTPPSQPTGIADEAQWRYAEERIGHSFPQDFKEINRHYGSGWFNNWVWILNPAKQEDAYSLLDYTTSLDVLLRLLHHTDQRFVGVGESLIVPIAWTTDGAELFYLMNDERHMWDVLVADLRAAAAEVHSMPFTLLLVNMLRGSLNSQIVPNTPAHGAPTFTSNRDIGWSSSPP